MLITLGTSASVGAYLRQQLTDETKKRRGDKAEKLRLYIELGLMLRIIRVLGTETDKTGWIDLFDIKFLSLGDKEERRTAY